MATNTTIRVISTSSEQTEKLAEKVGAQLRGGEVIELISDLGGGKTTFTRGLVRGAASSDRVASPTFTLSREYVAPNFTICHFDFYRLSEAGIVANELVEVMYDPQYVTVVEWGDIVEDILPLDRIAITITQTAEGHRVLMFTYPVSLSYVVEDL